MRIINTASEMRDAAGEQRSAGNTVGLVPTMGFFHAGHVSLMHAARRDCDFVVVSLFVNPTQFGRGEDLEDYPRDLERDTAMAEEAGVDCIFHPGVEEMYPQPYHTYVELEGVSGILCGASRPGHFRGVATVVAKLFNIVPAQRAYFGLKDAQQVWVIRKMARDLDFDIEVVACPTVREDDGLAMSSRNIYLGPQERKAATALNRSLQLAQDLASKGERDAAAIIARMEKIIAQEPLLKPEYIEVVGWEHLQPLQRLQGEVLIALAAQVGKARLIDNVLLEIPDV